MPRYSFIVPVYRVEKWLVQCIDSILSQEIMDLELILVDDGSPDSSGAICDEFAAKDSRVSVIHKENGGVSKARNIGIEVSSGKYIIFVDSDDWIECCLLKYVDAFVDDFEIVYYGHKNYCMDGDIVSYHPYSISCCNKEEMENGIVHLKYNSSKFEYFGYTWNKVFRSEIIKKNNIKFIEGLTLREDELFTMEYCQQISSLHVVSESLYNYRFMNNGLSVTEKSSAEILLFADNLYGLSQKWTDGKLKKLDTLRFVSQLLCASRKEKNILKCLSLTNMAYKVRKSINMEDMKIIINDPIKYSKLIGMSFSLFSCIINFLKKNASQQV